LPPQAAYLTFMMEERGTQIRNAGRLRRLIELRADADSVIGWLEDDFHHFGVTLHHRDGRIADVSAVAIRAPWTTCAGAAIPLRALIGQPLVERASDIGRLIDMRLQCTHIFDLAGLAIAHAWHRRLARRYEAVVPDRGGVAQKTENPRKTDVVEATLTCDGALVQAWRIDEERIVGPENLAGRPLNRGFRAWTEALPVDEAEFAFVLRRAIFVSGGRGVDLDVLGTADETGLPFVCHSLQPAQRLQALRNHGNTHDYAAGSEGMLASRHSRP
jgi:hypothetical protein